MRHLIATLTTTAIAALLLTGGAVAQSVTHTPLPEDEMSPAYSCRLDGNRTCGVQVAGARYAVEFTRGLPASVTRVA